MLEPIEAIKPLLRTDLGVVRDSVATFSAQKYVEGVNGDIAKLYEGDTAEPEEARQRWCESDKNVTREAKGPRVSLDDLDLDVLVPCFC